MNSSSSSSSGVESGNGMKGKGWMSMLSIVNTTNNKRRVKQ